MTLLSLSKLYYNTSTHYLREILVIDTIDKYMDSNIREVGGGIVDWLPCPDG